MIKDKETRETIEKLKKLASDSFQEIKGTLKLVQEKQANLEDSQKSTSSSVTLADPRSEDKIKEIENTIATMKADFQNAIDTVRVQLEDAAPINGKPRNVSIDDVPAEEKKKFLYRILEGLSDESFIELAEAVGKGALLADSTPLEPATLGDGQPAEASGAAAVATAEKPVAEASLADTGFKIYFDKKPEDGREYYHLDYINAWVLVK